MYPAPFSDLAASKMKNKRCRNLMIFSCIKRIKIGALGGRYRRPLIIFLGLALFTASLGGLAQQNISEDTGNRDDFDLDALIDGVTHAKSLGLLTKLSLKQDVDRFLKSLHNYHDGTTDSSLEQLRERYDVMIHKLVVLLQDKDTELVKSIDDGRDKLWELLSDEKKFASI
jgi:hypothetical protein